MSSLLQHRLTVEQPLRCENEPPKREPGQRAPKTTRLRSGIFDPRSSVFDRTLREASQEEIRQRLDHRLQIRHVANCWFPLTRQYGVEAESVRDRRWRAGRMVYGKSPSEQGL